MRFETSIQGRAGSISILNRDRELPARDLLARHRDVPARHRDVPTRNHDLPARDHDLPSRDSHGAVVNFFRYQRDDGETAEGEFSIATLGAGAFSILVDGRAYRVEPGAPGEWIVNGTPVAVKLVDPRAFRERQGSATSHGRVNIAAPMPGKIVRVLVSNGDTIEEGQGLLVVEAMKMQNEMKSPKAGRVVEVRAKPGSSVAAGEVLMVVE